MNDVNNDRGLVIIGDETWVYGYDVEIKALCSQWNLSDEPKPKKAREVRSNVKVLLTGFIDYNGVVVHEFLPKGRTVNKEYYKEVMYLCAKQYGSNNRNCGKTNREFCITTLCQLTHQCLFVIFRPKTKP